MKLKPLKFQGGGAAPAPAPEAAPAAPEQGGQAPDQGGQDPVMEIAQMAAEALQSGNCDSAMAVCQAFIELVQQMAGGGAPQEAPQGEPVYRKGGVLARRVSK